jgi:hypothetical protein
VANTDVRVMENSANTESWVMKNLVHTENRVVQDWGGGGQEIKTRKRCCSKQKASPTVVPKGYYQDTKHAYCKRCIKECWPRKKKRKSRTIGLTIYDP